MLLLLYLSVKRKIKTDVITTVLLIIGLTTALFCVSALLGYAQNVYLSERGINYSSTVTVDTNLSLGNEEILTCVNAIDAQYDNKLANVLYITGLKDGTVVIGWYGNKISKWFPTTSSRFFTDREVANCDSVIYMPYSEYIYAEDDSIAQKISWKVGESVLLDDEEYRIIGTGWITLHTFVSAISKESSQKLLLSNANQDIKIRIMPYSTFMKKYSPSLILLHFQDSSYEDLSEYSKLINNNTILGTAYTPDTNSNQMLQSEKIQELIIAMILVVLSGITIIQLMNQWLNNNKKQYIIYIICGLSKLKTFILIVAEWFIVFALATVLTEILHLCLLKPLSYLGAGQLPLLSDMLTVSIVLYILSLLIMIKPIKNLICTELKEIIL